MELHKQTMGECVCVGGGMGEIVCRYKFPSLVPVMMSKGYVQDCIF